MPRLLVLLWRRRRSAGRRPPRLCRASARACWPRRTRYLREAAGDRDRQLTSPRSAGGPHDFFSEGDYWWPDPAEPGRALHPEGRDEQSRQLQRSSPRADAAVGRRCPRWSPAYTLTKDRKYATPAARHARAWFVSRDDADDAGAALRAGDPRPRHRPRHRHHRHDPSRRSRARARAARRRARLVARRGGRGAPRGSPTTSSG